MAQLPEPPANLASPVSRSEVTVPAAADDPIVLEREAQLRVCVADAERCDAWVGQAWAALWREADILYQALRSHSAFEGSQVAAPNISRFTVAKLVNAVVPAIMKALFYQDPPFLLTGFAGAKMETLRAKTAVLARAFAHEDEKGRSAMSEIRKGWESCAIFGTQVYAWGGRDTVKRGRKYVRRGDPLTQQTPVGAMQVHTTESAQWKIERSAPAREFWPFLRHMDHRYALFDPKWNEPDARCAPYVIFRRYLSFDDLDDLRHDPSYVIPPREELAELFFPPEEQPIAPGTAETTTSGQTTGWGGTLHAMPRYEVTSADPFERPLELLERWDGQRVSVVLQRQLCIKGTGLVNPDVVFSKNKKQDARMRAMAEAAAGQNEFDGRLPVLSSNWWNVPDSGWGMGLGRIVGQDQRVDTGVTNACLKILSFAVNPDYIRGEGVNALTQNVRQRLGGVIAVAKDPTKAYVLKELPKVPAEALAMLQLSKQESESAAGADQEMIQGATPSQGRSSLGRSAAGATRKFAAAATRLEGPLSLFIQQVFLPYLRIMDELINDRMPSDQLARIVREECGAQFQFDEEEYRNTSLKGYDALAGAHLAAQSAMAQILPLLIELVAQPAVLSQLSEVNGEYMDFDRIVRSIMDMAGWRYEPFIRKMTDEMKQRMAAKAGSPQGKLAEKLAVQAAGHRDEMESNDQKAQNRIAEKLVVQGVLPEAEAPETVQ
jgi:hypothetical protein